MGKRQFRIFRKDLLAKQSDFLGKTGHVILTDHVVHNGTIKKLTDTCLTLVDYRSHQQHLPLPAIAEVVYDVETQY